MGSYITRRLIGLGLILVVGVLANLLKRLFDRGDRNQTSNVQSSNLQNSIAQNTNVQNSNVQNTNVQNSNNMSGIVQEQRNYAANDRMVMRMPTGSWYMMLALSILLFGFVMFILFLMVASGDGAEAWEEAASMIILLVTMVTLFVLAAGWFCYYWRKYTIAFDREGIVISKPFKRDEEIPWSSLSRIELEANRSLLYDQYGQVRLKVGAVWENFGLFCEVARERIEANRNRYPGEH